jgi:transposase InsO family protein
MLHVSRQAFYNYLNRKDRPWKYQHIADEMFVILQEDTCNDTYGRYRMHKALELKHENNKSFKLPSERTIYRIMNALNLSHRPKRNPKGITKADKEARKSDDLIKRNFKSDTPLTKAVTDITEIKARDGKLYVAAIFDCFDVAVLGLAMDTNMKAELVKKTMINACKSHPGFRGAVCHSDRGTQYTSQTYRDTIKKYKMQQSMNSAGGRCHDDARCESMWARLKDELFYSRNLRSTDYTVEELKVIIWRYFIIYWNNRRICSSNNGLPPMVKRQRYYASLTQAA